MQRTPLRVLTAAALAVGGYAFAPQAYAADEPAGQSTAAQTDQAAQKAADKTSDAARATGDKLTGNLQAKDADDIRKTLAEATEAGVKKGTFDDLVERTAAPDRQRIGKFAEQKFDDLDGRADQFLKDWKDKYNQDFNISKANDIYTDQFVSISGTNPGEARTAGEKIKEGAKDAGDAIKEGAKKAVGKETPADAAKQDQDRPRATVVIAGQPEVRVALVSEFPDRWKIDLPDSVDGQKLKDNVLKHLTMIDEDKANWPADKADAYRAVSHHILQAVQESADQDATPAAAQQPTPGTAAPGAPAPAQPAPNP